MIEHNPDLKSRQLAKIIRDLLRTDTFDTTADLTDALKHQCARLKITWTNDDIGNAYRLIESNTPLVVDRFRGLARKQPPEVIPESHSIPQWEAAQFYQQLLTRFGIESPLKAMPGADPSAEDLETAVEYGPSDTEHDRY